MFDKKYNVEELYILRVREVLYYVPLDVEGVYYDNYFTKEYYTVASSKDELTFKDVFKTCKYKTEGSIGIGVMRDILEKLPLKSYAEDINHPLKREEIGTILENFVEELKAAAPDINPVVLKPKMLKLTS